MNYNNTDPTPSPSPIREGSGLTPYHSYWDSVGTPLLCRGGVRGGVSILVSKETDKRAAAPLPCRGGVGGGVANHIRNSLFLRN